MEALCRIAVMKALPSDEEIVAADCSNAGEFLAQLKRDDEATYLTMMNARATAWGAERAHEPTPRCVAKMLEVLIYTIKTGSGQAEAGKKMGKLTERELRKWMKIMSI